MKMKIKRRVILSFAVLSLIVSSAFASFDSVTIASFSDPSASALNPMFLIDFENGTINGGWDQPGLDLELPNIYVVYENATFTMDQLSIPAGEPLGGYLTDPGPYTIRFSHQGDEVLNINFNQLYLQRRQSGMNAHDLYGDDVTINSVDYGTLTDAQFGFNFVNTGSSDPSAGYKATASFSSSAVGQPIPEPATIAILAIGGLFLKRTKK